MEQNPVSLTSVAFAAEPGRAPLYPAASQQQVLAALQRDVADGLHLLCLIGPDGSGKTVLLRALEQGLSQGLVSMIERPTPGGLLVDLAKSLQMDAEGASESSLRRRIVMQLSMLDQQRHPIILIVDSADQLSTEDLDLLLHFFPRGHATLILAASSDPGVWLAGCATSAGPVTIDRSYSLAPLTADETAAYIRHRLRQGGLSEDTFQPEMIALIHRESGGLPGLVNQFSADALARIDMQDEADGLYPMIAAGSEADIAGDLPRVAVDEAMMPGTEVSSGIEASPATDRRRSAGVMMRPVVAPREARDKMEHLAARATQRLRRSVRFWRTLAVLAILALVLDLSRDAWLKHVPAYVALFEELVGQQVSRMTGTLSSERQATDPDISESRVKLAEPSDVPVQRSDFAALHAPSTPNEAAKVPQPPVAPEASQSVAPPAETVAPEEPGLAPDSGSGSSVDEPEKAVTNARMDKDEVKDGGRKASNTARASRLPPDHRREIARLYAERAEYEWRNGEPGAAVLSVQRGLATDPHNPRLLEMRATLWQLMREEP